MDDEACDQLAEEECEVHDEHRDESVDVWVLVPSLVLVTGDLFKSGLVVLHLWLDVEDADVVGCRWV